MDYPGTCSAVLLKIAILLVSLSEITQVHGELNAGIVFSLCDYINL